MALARPILEELPEASLILEPTKGKTLRTRRARAFDLRLKISIAAALVVGLAICYLALHAEYVRLSYELAAAEKQLEETVAFNERLAYQMSQLKSLDRIEMAARGKLSMTEPGQTRFVVLPSRNHNIPASSGDWVPDGTRIAATKPGEPKGLLEGLVRAVSGLVVSSQTAEAGTVGRGY